MNVPTEFLVFKIKLAKRCLLLCLVLSSVFLVLGRQGIAQGVFIGGIIAILVLSLLSKYILALRGVSALERRKFLIPRALGLYAIMGITLFIAIKKGIAVFLGAALGLLLLKLVVYLEVFTNKQCKVTN